MFRTTSKSPVIRAVTGAALVCLGLAACAPGGNDPGPVAEHWDVVERYCFDCHNPIDRAGELVLEGMSPETVAADAAVWEKALRKLRGGLMPPPGQPRPPAERETQLVASLERHLADAITAPRPGFVGLHRLNRTEYANAVRDLLGVDVDVEALLPRDNSKDGYDNNASVLTISPTFMEQFVAAARTVAVQAVGDPDAAPGSTTYINDNTASFKRYREGLPLGTRGGLAVVHDFPADGRYRINVADMAQALWVYNMEFENTLVVTLDEREVYRLTIGGEKDQKAIDQNGVSAVDRINRRLKDIPFDATAGPHEVAVAFLARSFAESDDRLQQPHPGGGQDRLLEVSSFEIQGPFETRGISATPARDRIFSCYPAPDAAPAAVDACARSIVGRLARLAYRGRVADADFEDLMAFYRAGLDQGGFDTGVRRALTAILSAPEFLFRYAAPDQPMPPGSVFELDAFELASRLSFFLWSSLPDEELLEAAESGRLGEPDVLRQQVRRMLADPRAAALVSNFAFQWLDVEKLDDVEPDRQIFPHAASTDPREHYKRELELFLRSILLEDRSVIELLTAEHTYLNETVALMYGMDDIRGDQFRRVELKDSARFGLLGKGAVLMAMSYPNRTAPVLRGQFVLDNLMGSPPSPPPPGVDTDLAPADTAKPTTVREQLELHRAEPTCNACHGVMDPLGLTLENFDAIGAWRDRDKFADTVIDVTGELPSGVALDGPDALRDVLAAQPERFARTLTEELMTYALGRSLEYYDMPAVRRIVDEAAQDDYRFSALVLGIVESDAFRMLEIPGDSETMTATAAAAPTTAGRRQDEGN